MVYPFAFVKFEHNQDEPNDPIAVFNEFGGITIHSVERYASVFLDVEGRAAMAVALIDHESKTIYLANTWVPSEKSSDIVSQVQAWVEQYKLNSILVSPVGRQGQELERHPIRSLLAEYLPELPSRNGKLLQPAAAKLRLDVEVERGRACLDKLPGAQKFSALLSSERFTPLVCAVLQAIDSPPPERYWVTYEGTIDFGSGDGYTEDESGSIFDPELRSEANDLRRMMGLEPY